MQSLGITLRLLGGSESNSVTTEIVDGVVFSEEGLFISEAVLGVRQVTHVTDDPKRAYRRGDVHSSER